MHVSCKKMEPSDIVRQQSSRAWSQLRILACQFSAETGRFDGDPFDALELIFTVMDLVAETGAASEEALAAARQPKVSSRTHGEAADKEAALQNGTTNPGQQDMIGWPELRA